MKIGIVTEYFYPTLGGISENVYHSSLELMRSGHDFRIITGYKGEPGEIDPEVRRRMIFIGRSVPLFFNGSSGCTTIDRNLSRCVKKVLKSECFDIIHLHSPLLPMLPFIVNAYANAPIVGTFHTCTGGDNLLYRVGRPQLKKLLDRMAGRIAVSECCAREHHELFGRDFDVIPNGVDVAWWSNGGLPLERFDDGKTNILFLGRPDMRNGLDIMIRAFARLHPRHPQTRLIIVGDGLLRFHFERLVPRAIRNSVVFEGAAKVSRPRYTASAHIFCFLPTIASFGVTILEGMSAKQAIVASDIEAFRAIVKDGESALLVPPRDEGAVAFAIERLIENPQLRERLGTAAYANVGQYDWKKVAEMQLEYYRRIADN